MTSQFTLHHKVWGICRKCKAPVDNSRGPAVAASNTFKATVPGGAANDTTCPDSSSATACANATVWLSPVLADYSSESHVRFMKRTKKIQFSYVWQHQVPSTLSIPTKPPMKVLEDVPNVVAATSYQRYLDCREPRRSHKGFVRKAWESTLQHLTLLWEHQGEDASATVNRWAYPWSCWKPWGERDCLPIFLRTDANYLPQAEADLGEFQRVWPALEFLVRPPYLKRVSHWSTTVGPHSPHLRTGEQRPQLKPIVLWAPKDAKAMMPHAQPDLATVPSPGKECSTWTQPDATNVSGISIDFAWPRAKGVSILKSLRSVLGHSTTGTATCRESLHASRNNLQKEAIMLQFVTVPSGPPLQGANVSLHVIENWALLCIDRFIFRSCQRVLVFAHIPFPKRRWQPKLGTPAFSHDPQLGKVMIKSTSDY